MCSSQAALPASIEATWISAITWESSGSEAVTF